MDKEVYMLCFSYQIDETLENIILCPDCKSDDCRLINFIHHKSDYPDLNKTPEENKGRKGHYIDPVIFQCKKCKCLFPEYQKIEYEPIPQNEPIVW